MTNSRAGFVLEHGSQTKLDEIIMCSSIRCTFLRFIIQCKLYSSDKQYLYLIFFNMSDNIYIYLKISLLFQFWSILLKDKKLRSNKLECRETKHAALV